MFGAGVEGGYRALFLLCYTVGTRVFLFYFKERFHW